MAGKRSATSELNHDNWNDDETPEEAGTFSKASEEVLQKRTIKSARRRIVNSGDGAPKAAFGSFTGFKSTSAAAASPFSFLANSASAPSTKIISEKPSNTVRTSNGSANGSEPKEAERSKSKVSGSDKMETEQSGAGSKGGKKSNEYYGKLKGLNESVAQWIKSHVDSNPFCILTPIFRDYEKYLKEIEAKHGVDSASGDKNEKFGTEVPPAKRKSNSTVETPEKTVFGNSPAPSGESKTESSIFGKVNAGKSIFGNTESQSTEAKSVFGNIGKERNPFLSQSFSPNDAKKETASEGEQKSTQSLSFPQTGPSATFSFGQSSATSTVSAGFSFGGGKPFSFGNVAKTGESEETKEDEDNDEDDEPPKVEFKPVTEEGAIYEQRCKVFVKKDGNFTDRGVGTLFLKPTPNEKTQLIVRADTSCGNLLLNTILNDTIPTQRMGKNNVMMVLLPTPESKPPPTPILLRVKTGEDADALLEVLNKHKK